jgi:hypothetical protein
MTGELIDHDAIGKLTAWIYQTNVTREKPVQIANPMPPKEM